MLYETSLVSLFARTGALKTPARSFDAQILTYPNRLLIFEQKREYSQSNAFTVWFPLPPQ